MEKLGKRFGSSFFLLFPLRCLARLAALAPLGATGVETKMQKVGKSLPETSEKAKEIPRDYPKGAKSAQERQREPLTFPKQQKQQQNSKKLQ